MSWPTLNWSSRSVAMGSFRCDCCESDNFRDNICMDGYSEEFMSGRLVVAATLCFDCHGYLGKSCGHCESESDEEISQKQNPPSAVSSIKEGKSVTETPVEMATVSEKPSWWTKNLVWCVYEGLIDGDGFLHWDMVFLASTPERAKEIVSGYKNVISEGLHPTMNKENHWTYVGDRSDIAYNAETMSHREPGGYVIEKQEVQ